jgi:hypothetical protein
MGRLSRADAGGRLVEAVDDPRHFAAGVDRRPTGTVATLNESANVEARHGGAHSNIWLGFVPWILFAVLCRRDSLQAAVVVGLVGALIIALPGVLAGRPKLLELGTIAFFAVFVVVVFVVDPGADDFLSRYGRAIATAGLALIAALSLLIDRPFTEQYAREQVDPGLWKTERFAELNRHFTAAWALVFTLMACSHVVAGAIDTQRAETIFNWVIPIALIVVVVKYMGRAREEGGGAGPARSDPE